jgi:ketosteroid isomerase-like protein
LQDLKTITAVVLAAMLATPLVAQTRNSQQEAVKAMLKADRDFDRAAADRDIDRFIALVSEDAAFDSAEGRGREAIKKAWAPFFQKDGPTLRWTPAKGEALVGGDVGYTIGTWERRGRNEAGQLFVRRGEYLTVWRKEKDGVWRATYDTGSTR